MNFQYRGGETSFLPPTAICARDSIIKKMYSIICFRRNMSETASSVNLKDNI